MPNAYLTEVIDYYFQNGPRAATLEEIRSWMAYVDLKLYPPLPASAPPFGSDSVNAAVVRLAELSEERAIQLVGGSRFVDDLDRHATDPARAGPSTRL